MERNGDVLNNVLIERLSKRRPPGRPRTKWKDTVENHMRLINENATIDWTLDIEN